MEFPIEVQTIIATLKKQGFEAYVVGGCVRDVLLRRIPQDWDIATNAQPQQIQQLFPHNFYANRFGTVTVLTDSTEPSLQEIEVTTYRVDSTYSDKRRPDSVAFTPHITEDLARRDFTINALAMDEEQMLDPFGGQEDLEKKVIRAVGDPHERFQEDALRLLRAIRLSAQLQFAIDEATFTAIKTHAKTIEAISQERIRDELVRIVMSDNPEQGFMLLNKSGLLKYILPEVAAGVAIEQNKHHTYTVFVHLIKSLQYAAHFKYPFHIRLAALMHDVGKPKTRHWSNGDYTFYGHEIVGARMTETALKRLRFSGEIIETVTRLVRHHMFYYDIGKVTEAGARRLLRRVGGKEVFADLIKLRIAERKGSGVPKAEPYRLRHLQFLVEKASQAPISVGQLKINGTTLINDLKIPPGPVIGGILHALLAEVIDDPNKNTADYLMHRAKELQHEDSARLKALGAKAIEGEEERREEEIRRKYHV